MAPAFNNDMVLSWPVRQIWVKFHQHLTLQSLAHILSHIFSLLLFLTFSFADNLTNTHLSPSHALSFIHSIFLPLIVEKS
jgi:hypothetical protein